ncbi:MAG TPA: hypothetical protein VG737_06635 [Cyclobacteriaceae bacterium]|nr:hypothetical protein [Cyclobacteriaceae bacterium]
MNGHDLIFENHWKSMGPGDRAALVEFWKTHAPALSDHKIAQRLDQVVFIVRRQRDGKIVAESTSEKVFIRQLKNNLYNIRTMVARERDISPALFAKLVTETFRHLESIHRQDVLPQAIGVITLIEHDGLKRVLSKAILSASGLVFIGNSPRGHQIRVRYFSDAVIN